jgi:hypothetical protein
MKGICSLARKEEEKNADRVKTFQTLSRFSLLLVFQKPSAFYFSLGSIQKKRKLSSVTTTDTRSAAAFIQTPLSFQGLSLSLYLYIYSQQRILCLSLSILYT